MPQESQIIVKFFSADGTYLILDCQHWYKWTGKDEGPKVGTYIICPTCNIPKVLNNEPK
jgi:hypothetical protein